MKEIRFHGRGGQGIVRAAHIIVHAVVDSGGYAQFVPFFGVERKGSPVYGFLRISDQAIHLKTQVYRPELLVILDETLLDVPETFAGFQKGGTVLVNTGRAPEELIFPVEPSRVAAVNATSIALEKTKRDIPNTAILGAFCRVTGWADWRVVKNLVTDSFGLENAAAAERAYNQVRIQHRGESNA